MSASARRGLPLLIRMGNCNSLVAGYRRPQRNCADFLRLSLSLSLSLAPPLSFLSPAPSLGFILSGQSVSLWPFSSVNHRFCFESASRRSIAVLKRRQTPVGHNCPSVCVCVWCVCALATERSLAYRQVVRLGTTRQDRRANVTLTIQQSRV